MAVFKLGAIVTALVGSIGGTTFRRGANSLVMQQKSFGGARSKLLRNPRLNQIGFIFNQFTTLSIEAQTDWNDLAATIQFPDRFGDLKYLTGRQLFSKLNTQLLPLELTILDATTVDTTINTFIFESVEVSTSPNVAYVILNSDSGPVYCTISAELTQNLVTSPQFTTREIIAFQYIDEITLVNFAPGFFKKFPFASPGMWASIFITPVNESGFKGTPLYIPYQIE